jgi:ABC-type branched-subunit amino acid transport system substrate-binding protein
MRPRSARLLAIAIAATFVTSCASSPWGERSATPEERAAYEAAMDQLESDPAAAKRALEAFVATWADGPLGDDAEYQLGRLAEREGDAETALLHYYRAAKGYPNGDHVDLARVRVAVLERERGNPAAARAILGNLRTNRLPPGEAEQAYRVLADVAPDPVARLRWLSLLRGQVSQREVDAIDVEIDAVLASLDAKSLDRAARQLGDRPPAARVEIARAERAMDAGDLDEAEAALERAGRLPLAPRHAQRLAAARARLRGRHEGPTDVAQLPTFASLAGRALPPTAGASGAIGVVLPLSGPFAHFGEESLQGILLAAGVFGEEPGAPSVRVVVKDSAGRPDLAAAAVRELARDEEVSAIVGPLLSAEAAAAAAAAQDERIPLLALTAREEIARDRSHVFRLRTRPVEDVQLLVDRARRDGAQRFAILYRDDAYGRGLRSLFWDAVEASGGEIVGVAAYDPKATDFAGPIRSLVGYTLLSAEEKRLLGRREKMMERARRLPAEEALVMRQRARALTRKDGMPLPPIVDFDALFIPESHENIVLIAPQLAFHEVTDTQLLGPDGWYHRDLVRLAGEHIDGAVFAAHFYPESPVPYVRSFTDRYSEAFARAPDAFSAEAYDAARLVLVQLARGYTDRDAMREGVLGTEAYPGVSGVIAMRADGNAHKRPFLLGIERRRVVQYED